MAFAWMLHERTFDLLPLCHKRKVTRLLYTFCQGVSCTPMTAENVLHQTLKAVMDWKTCSYYLSCPGSSGREGCCSAYKLFELPHHCSYDKWCLVVTSASVLKLCWRSPMRLQEEQGPARGVLEVACKMDE